MNESTEVYIFDIIGRMCEPVGKLEPGFDSSQTVSWKAHREAEQVDNTDLVRPLMAYIDQEKDKKRRDPAYFLLGHIAKNTGDRVALGFLIGRVEQESDKYVVAALLDRIAPIRKPLGTDLAPLIRAAKNTKWLIRHSAIQSLNHSEDKIAEATMIEILEHSEDPYDLIYANATLNQIGTAAAIPFLEKHLKSRKRDVRHSAKCAIEEITKRKG